MAESSLKKNVCAASVNLSPLRAPQLLQYAVNEAVAVLWATCCWRVRHAEVSTVGSTFKYRHVSSP